MSSFSGFLIRDGLESDISACLQLDHSYESDYVWQMTTEEGKGRWQISFNVQRLPRTLETSYQANAHHLRLSIPHDQCFLVAVAKGTHEYLGYLTLRHDPVHQIALVQDVVISLPYRRQRIGTRLLNAARQWAREQQALQLTIELQTKNFPGITFTQHAGFRFSGYNDQYFPSQDIALFFSQSLR